MEKQPQRPLPAIAWFALFVTAFYFAYRYGLAFSHQGAAPFWLPGSVLLCGLLWTPPRWWPLLLAATVPIRLWSSHPLGTPIGSLLATTAVDGVAAMLAALLLRWRLADPLRFATLRDFGRYCLIAVILAPLVDSTLSTLVRAGWGAALWSGWEPWFWGKALANLIVPPFIFYWVLRPPAPAQLSRAQLAEAGLLLVGLPLSLWTAFYPPAGGSIVGLTSIYAPVACLIWAAARFGVRATSAAIVLFAAFVMRAASSRLGPFVDDSAQTVATHMQHFLLLPAVPLYLVAVLTDASRRSEQSLRESERRFREIADSAPVLIWTTDRDKNCNFLNKGWLDFTGRTLDQELGLGWRASVHPDDLAQVQSSIATVDGRLPIEHEYRLRRHDGEYRWILIRGVPRYGPGGEFLGYIGLGIDVTERKRLEEADRQLSHAARLATLGELTAVVSHEVSQPLFAILSNTEAADILLQQDPPPIAEVRQILADIYQDDLRASEVIRVVRTLTHKRTPAMGPINLNELVMSIVRLVKADAVRRRVEIRPELAAQLPPVVADESSLEQVLLNLLINSMDAMRDTAVGSRQITVTTRQTEDGSVQIAVADRGHGIAPENMPQLFDSFFTTKPDGMGLGLSTARQIVQSHKGRIWATNNQGPGATFFVTLPSVEAEQPKISAPAGSSSEPESPELPAEAAMQRDWIGKNRFQASERL